MRAVMERRLSWVLTAGGVLGLAWATIAILPRAIELGALTFGPGGDALSGIPPRLIGHLPPWLWWMVGPSIGPGAGVALIFLAFVCGLVVVTGRPAARVVAGLGVLWFAYVVATLSSGGYWVVTSALSGNPGAYAVLTLVSLGVVALVSVFALLTAKQLGGRLRD